MRALRPLATLAAGWLALAALAAQAAPAHPDLIPGAQLPTAIFAGPRAKVTTGAHGETIRDVVSVHTPDRKFMSGAYSTTGSDDTQTGPNGYPVNEFMLFLTGGVTLTSADGTVTVVKPGDGVTIPKGWVGRWQSGPYSKFYVIYDDAGPVE